MLDVSLFLFYLREFHVGPKLQATALKKINVERVDHA